MILCCISADIGKRQRCDLQVKIRQEEWLCHPICSKILLHFEIPSMRVKEWMCNTAREIEATTQPHSHSARVAGGVTASLPEWLPPAKVKKYVYFLVKKIFRQCRARKASCDQCYCMDLDGVPRGVCSGTCPSMDLYRWFLLCSGMNNGSFSGCTRTSPHIIRD